MTQAKLLYGGAAIGTYLGMTARQVFHRHEVGDIPVFKIGGKLCAHKDKLDTWRGAQASGAGRGNEYNDSGNAHRQARRMGQW